MKDDVVVMDLRGDIESDDLEQLHALTEGDDTSEVMLTSQLSGESILKIVVSIAKFGPKFSAAFHSIIRADNIKVLKIETKNLKLTIENVNPKHFESVSEFIVNISK